MTDQHLGAIMLDGYARWHIHNALNRGMTMVALPAWLKYRMSRMLRGRE